MKNSETLHIFTEATNRVKQKQINGDLKMNDYEYYSMFHRNEIIERLEKLEAEKTGHLVKESNFAHEMFKLEKEITDEHPELEKKIAKIKKYPNTAREKVSQLAPEYDNFHQKCRNFLDKFYYVAYESDRELKKIQGKIDDYNRQKADIESKLAVHFQLRDNLPEQFTEALEIVRKRIFEWFESSRDAKIELFTKYQKTPIYSAFCCKYNDSKYFLEYCQKSGWKFSFVAAASDEDIIKSLKEVGIEKYYGESIEKRVENYSKYFVIYCQKVIQAERNRNIQKEADTYFEVEKCRFIDEIVQNCAEVKSVEDIKIGLDGSINGIIHASNGTFNLRSIGAGGYNIQCFHYRVIITKIGK